MSAPSSTSAPDSTSSPRTDASRYELRPLWGPRQKVWAALAGVGAWVLLAVQVGLLDPESAVRGSLVGQLVLGALLLGALALLGRALREAAGFWHPRVVVTTDVRVPAPGDELELGWRLAGRTRAVRSLELWLERRREVAPETGLAAWAWGPATWLLERLAAKIDDPDVTERHAIGAWPRAATEREGRARVRLPESARSSYVSKRVRYRWLVVARLSMEGLPTLEQELELRVARRRAVDDPGRPPRATGRAGRRYARSGRSRGSEGP